MSMFFVTLPGLLYAQTPNDLEVRYPEMSNGAWEDMSIDTPLPTAVIVKLDTHSKVLYFSSSTDEVTCDDFRQDGHRAIDGEFSVTVGLAELPTEQRIADQQVIDVISAWAARSGLQGTVYPLDELQSHSITLSGFAPSQTPDAPDQVMGTVDISGTISGHDYFISGPFQARLCRDAFEDARSMPPRGEKLTTADFSIVGVASGDQARVSISSAGDVDGDGRADILIGAPASDEGGSDAGSAYLILGKRLKRKSDLIDLSEADYRFTGEQDGDRAGESVSSAGDVDGDGLDDFLIGATKSDESEKNAGQVYLILGSSLDSRSATVSLSEADHSFTGETAYDEAGVSVSSAGDVDGDGLDDFLVGANLSEDEERYAHGDAGRSYLILGSSLGPQPTTTSLAAAAEIYDGEDSGDYVGGSLSAAGDIDGDGLDDILIGAAGANHRRVDDVGKAYLILGSSLGKRFSYDLATRDFSFLGENRSDYAGQSVSSAGDVNGDGRPDILIGASGDDEGGKDAGKAYLILSSSLDGEDSDADLAQADYRFVGVSSGDNVGVHVSGAGDIDGDGLDDLLIGASGDRVYVFLASSLSSSRTIAVSQADYFFELEGTGEFSRWSVSSAGDVDGDGLDDLLIATTNSEESDGQDGRAFVLLGGSLSGEPRSRCRWLRRRSGS